ncbi:MAG TPA: bifunctional diguanylate cyclase/phosphodiesterase [Nautiliaceae bacterium]|nr:bifunctional diguanylate cyclase/phosphodiesterase [Nautiliaceae bacterium]
MKSNLKITILLLFLINALIGSIYFIIQRNYKLNYTYLFDKTIELQKRKILTFDLNEKVSNIGNILLSIGTEPFMNEAKIKFKQERIKKFNEEIASILNLLKDGGTIKQEVLTNSVSKEYDILSLSFTPEKKLIYIDNIKSSLNILNNYINKVFKIYKNKVELSYHLKLTPSIINRVKENINNYLIFNNARIGEIEKKERGLLKRFEFFQIVFLLLAIIANGVIVYFIYRNLEIVNEELKKRLYYDSLTSLKNRNLLKEELKEDGVLVVIDIDKFSIYNELYGNKVGDEILIELSKIFTSFEHLSKENVYRIGSDEFAFYFNNNEVNVKEFLERLLKKLKNTILKINNIKLENLTFKAGVSTIPNHLDNALIALIQAKKRNKCFYVFSKEDMRKELKKIRDALYWTKKIEEAIKKDLIVPLFQPIVDKNKNIVKYETLMRLKDKDKLIPPFFLDIALKNNQYYDLLKIMFNKTIECIIKKQVHLSFNVSYLDLVDDDVYEFLKKEVSKLKSPELLTLEILENEKIVDYKKINKRILYFKNLGVKLAIDDFGSGYSNYRHILELNVDFLKIDGSLIKDILEDKNSFYVVESIVSFAKKMKIKTIAEFVENKEVFHLLKEIGVDYFQGHYFSKPIIL